MSDCQHCNAEHLCIYEYKPCDCFDMRKFKPHPDMVGCDACEKSGVNPYPIMCKVCSGTGAVIKSDKG